MKKHFERKLVVIALIIICFFAVLNVNKINSEAASTTDRLKSYNLNIKHDFSIMSQNLKYQVDTDGENNTIDKRYERLSKQLDRYDTDIKCFQEFNTSWKSRIMKKLSTNDYYYVQSPYTRTKLSNAIFVKKSKFTLIDSGYMVVTATSSATSDRSRYASWMKVKHIKTGKTVVIMNTHVTPHCTQRQIVSCKRIKNSEIIKNADRYIICGDFNIRRTIHKEAYGIMTADGTKDMCKVASQEGVKLVAGGTFHKWETKAVDSRPRLDYFFGSPNLKSTMYTLVNDPFDGGFVSDHYGIMNYVSFK